MKNLVFMVILLFIGYFAYQYFLIPWLDDFAPAESITDDDLPPIPGTCRVKGEIVEDAIIDRKLGKISDVVLNQYTVRFKTCLKNEGFSDADADGAYDKIMVRAEQRDNTKTER